MINVESEKEKFNLLTLFPMPAAGVTTGSFLMLDGKNPPSLFDA